MKNTKRIQRVYTPEVKQEIIAGLEKARASTERGSVRAYIKEVGVSPSVIHKWIAKHNTQVFTKSLEVDAPGDNWKSGLPAIVPSAESGVDIRELIVRRDLSCQEILKLQRQMNDLNQQIGAAMALSQ